jgi:thiosulfate dehydrogenase [quinone] large subunit
VACADFFARNAASAPFWFIVRLYAGSEWLSAGVAKVTSPAWFGTNAGAALKGFVAGALAKTGGEHPDVQSWYAAFLHNIVLPHAGIWSNIVSIGEVLVGVGLIIGLFTVTAAAAGFFMNINYLLAGAVSLNPVLLVLELGILTASRVAGRWGLDRYVQPLLEKNSHKTQ